MKKKIILCISIMPMAYGSFFIETKSFVETKNCEEKSKEKLLTDMFSKLSKNKHLNGEGSLSKKKEAQLSNIKKTIESRKSEYRSKDKEFQEACRLNQKEEPLINLKSVVIKPCYEGSKYQERSKYQIEDNNSVKKNREENNSLKKNNLVLTTNKSEVHLFIKEVTEEMEDQDPGEQTIVFNTDTKTPVNDKKAKKNERRKKAKKERRENEKEEKSEKVEQNTGAKVEQKPVAKVEQKPVAKKEEVTTKEIGEGQNQPTESLSALMKKKLAELAALKTASRKNHFINKNLDYGPKVSLSSDELKPQFFYLPPYHTFGLSQEVCQNYLELRARLIQYSEDNYFDQSLMQLQIDIKERFSNNSQLSQFNNEAMEIIDEWNHKKLKSRVEKKYKEQLSALLMKFYSGRILQENLVFTNIAGYIVNLFFIGSNLCVSDINGYKNIVCNIFVYVSVVGLIRER